MPITFNPQITSSQKISFSAEELQLQPKEVSKSFVSEPKIDVKKPTLAPQKAETSNKGILATLAYAWVNLAEGAKGILKGIFYGALAGGLVAAVNSITNGIERKSKGEIRLLQIFNPKQAMSRTGKILSVVTAATVLAGNLILARLRANVRTANIDHMFYEGHRDK